MLLYFIVAFVALTLMAMGYWVRRPAVGIAAGAFWLIDAAQAFVLSMATWDIYFALYIVSVGLGIVAFLEGFVLKPKEEKREQMMDDDEDWKAWEAEQKHYQERLDVRRTHKTNISKN